MESYLLDWAGLLVRWLHLIVGIAWIGSSFYFVWLDNHLTPPADAADVARGVHGELWGVHGGGFYHSRKYLTGPRGEPLTEDLHWFKWEAYSTWFSGMGLLAIIYWFGAGTYLIDRGVMALTVPVAISVSIAFIVAGWIVYDTLCRVLAGRESLLAGAVFAYVMLCAWALFQVFGARAAYVHVGVIMGTMMVANVLMVIIPGQRRMVEDIRAGREPNPIYGQRGKTRSTHNTYFTLPVLFIMISNHYPMTYSAKNGWLVLGAIMLAGVLIRQFFVLRHKKVSKPALVVVAVAILVTTAAAIAPSPVRFADGGKPSFAQVKAVIDRRCIGCHAAQPTQPGFAQPPKGVILESAEGIAQHSAKIAETVGNRYMPIGNLTQMTDDERALVGAWFAPAPQPK